MIRRLAGLPSLRLSPTRQQHFPIIQFKYLPSVPTGQIVSIRKYAYTNGRTLPQTSESPADLAIPRTMQDKLLTSNFGHLVPERKTVLIIGGSIAGAVLALQLLTHPILRSKYRPIIFDSAATLPNLGSPNDTVSSHPEGQTGAAVALTKQAMWPLRQLGLGLELDEISQNTERISMYRQPFFGPQDGSQPGVSIVDWNEPQGIMGGLWTIQRGSLQALLIKKILERGGEIIPNKKLINIIEHDQCFKGEGNGPQEGALEVIFADNTSYHGDVVVGADGAWSTVRRHIYSTPSPSGKKLVDEAWKPDFQNLHIVHGISHAQTTDIEPTMYAMGLSNVGTGSWTLKDNCQMWTIYEGPCIPPPNDPESRARSEEANKALSEKWNMEVFTGGYDQSSTEAFIERYRNVWHPSTGTYGRLFDATVKIVRVGLWQKVFTRLANVQWAAGERKPKECGKDAGGSSGRGNIVLIGDAAKVLMPTAGQGAAFAIEDATVLADCLLNYPPHLVENIPNFSTAVKEYTRQRLPRYQRISTMAYWGARIGIGRTWADRFVRDYLAGLAPAPKSGAWDQRERSWWEKLDGQEWLLEPKFEVKLRGNGGGE